MWRWRIPYGNVSGGGGEEFVAQTKAKGKVDGSAADGVDSV